MTTHPVKVTVSLRECIPAAELAFSWRASEFFGPKRKIRRNEEPKPGAQLNKEAGVCFRMGASGWHQEGWLDW